MLSEDELLLASASRYLLATGKNEAAQMLLTCSLSLEEVEGIIGISNKFVVTAPAEAFQTLVHDELEITRDIKNALLRTVPPRGGFKFRISDPIDFVIGFPDRKPEEQAKLLQYA